MTSAVATEATTGEQHPAVLDGAASSLTSGTQGETMNKRSKSIPLLALVAVIALVLGSFGTATAAGLTKKKVKAIATKVVNKKAPTLSVANAANAANAAALNGQPASAYQNASYRYRLPVQAAASEKVYSFPGLPPGKYLFTYNVLAIGGAAGMFCHMRPTSANTNGESFQYATVSGGVGTISASGIVETTATANLRCFNGANFTIYGGADVTSSVTFTRLDTLTAGTTTAPGAVGGAATAPLTR